MSDFGPLDGPPMPPGYRLAWAPEDVVWDHEPVTAAGTDEFYAQPRDRRGRWVSPGHGGPGTMDDPVTAAEVGRIEQGLFSGQTMRCSPDRIDALMRDLPNRPVANLEHLNVSGKGNEHLFTTHAREIPRKDMPQIPETAEGMANFKAALGSRKATLVEMDPRELIPTQNELSSANVGKLYGYIKDGGWRGDSVLFAAKNGEIIDGHHRWAAASAVCASGTPFKVKVLKIDAPIDEVLGIAHSVSGEHASINTGLGASAVQLDQDSQPPGPPPSPNEPWLWIDGQWLYVITDTGDDVPTDLSILNVNEQSQASE